MPKDSNYTKRTSFTDTDIFLSIDVNGSKVQIPNSVLQAALASLYARKGAANTFTEDNIFEGTVIVPTPSGTTEATNKAYVDLAVAGGGAFNPLLDIEFEGDNTHSGTESFDANPLVPYPTESEHAANLESVTDAISNLKDAVNSWYGTNKFILDDTDNDLFEVWAATKILDVDYANDRLRFTGNNSHTGSETFTGEGTTDVITKIVNIGKTGAGTQTNINSESISITTDACAFDTEVFALLNLPTSDPSITGALWNSSGDLKISAG